MYANSRDIHSAQSGPHDRLPELLRRHAAHPYQKPIAGHARDAFEALVKRWDGRKPLLLDAGCGVGWSTLQLAQHYPDHFVIGIDQSESRITRGKPGGQGGATDNVMFMRTDLTDFWRVLDEANVRLARHYILYPNPWPKIGHLSRRWHGSPVFPVALKLGGVLECRSNWRIYLEEMAIAIKHIAERDVAIESLQVDDPLTPFERKYRDSGQALYRLQIDLTHDVGL